MPGFGFGYLYESLSGNWKLTGEKGKEMIEEKGKADTKKDSEGRRGNRGREKGKEEIGIDGYR